MHSPKPWWDWLIITHSPWAFFQDWWDEVKNQLDKPGLDKKKMRALYDAMFSSLCDSRAMGFGSFRKKFIQVKFH